MKMGVPRFYLHRIDIEDTKTKHGAVDGTNP
jgi:hypothetical protein